VDKTDIVHALNQYVEKLNIVLKTLNVYIHEDVPGVTFIFFGALFFFHNIWICSCGVPFKLHYETNKFS
jgi:hypothetical protein